MADQTDRPGLPEFSLERAPRALACRDSTAANIFAVRHYDGRKGWEATIDRSRLHWDKLLLQ